MWRLTCGHDVEDAGLGLGALIVAPPAEESAVIQLCRWSVRRDRTGALAGHVSLSNVHSFRGVIKFPSERDIRRISFQRARDFRGLLPAYAEDVRLTVPTNRCDCPENKHTRFG